MSLRNLFVAGVTGAALALGAGAAVADDLPEAGDECKRYEVGEIAALADGTVLECETDPDDVRSHYWVVVEEPDPEPTPDPEPDPDPEPTQEPEPDPEPDPEPEPSPEGDDGWGYWVAEQEEAPEGVHPGQFCKGDDALKIYGYTESSVIQCLYNKASDRNQWVEISDFEDLVIEDDDDNGDGKPDDDEGDKDGKEDKPDGEPHDGERVEAGADDTLPVTGGALVGLVAAGVAALGGGGTALYLSRKRKATDDGEGVE